MDERLAIRLRGVVKRYGDITAVDGLDLDVPEGTCVGLLGPNGAGKSTTMRLLTAQSIADEGELELLGYKLPDESKQARAELGVVPQLDNLDTTLTVAQNLLVFTHLYRIGRAERRAAIERALEMAKLVDRRDTRVDKLSGRHAATPADRTGARPPAAPRAARRAHRRARPAGAPGALGADRRAAQRGHDDPHVDALHRGGAAPRRHRADHVARQRRRRGPAGRARATSTRADEVVEVYGPPARLAEVEAEAGAAGSAHAANGHEHLRSSESATATARASRASGVRRTSRTSSSCSPARRSTERARGATEAGASAGSSARRSRASSCARS